MERFCLLTKASETGCRIDVFLSESLSMTRSSVQTLIEKGNVTIAGAAVPKNYRLRENEQIDVLVPDAVELQAVAQDIPLEIVYEDRDLLVVNKPKGMVVHPAAGHYDGTLVNALMAHCKGSLSGINGVIRPGIVHRIDKDTSGLLIVAKNDAAHAGLAEQIKVHSFTRVYEAVVVGHPSPDQGTVDAPIGRHPTDRKKMTVTEKNSRPAVTHYETLAQYGGYAHMRLKLETGRTHQIRVHMAYLHHPVAGDTVYGSKKPVPGLQGQCLHAKEIGFVHPITGESLYFSSELPAYFLEFLQKIR